MKAIARALAWLCVAVPLGWGVYQSVQKSLPLFKVQPKPAATNRTPTTSNGTRGSLTESMSLKSTGAGGFTIVRSATFPGTQESLP